MKRTLREDLERIHSITYGNKILQEQGFLDDILKKVGLSKIDEPKKADLVSPDVEEFFNTLQRSSEQGGISQQERGSMTFQKEVETMQIGLVLLGYELPSHGIDGLFGPETASAVGKFISEKVSGDTKTSISEAFVQLNSTNYSHVKYDKDATQYDQLNQALLDDLQTAASKANVVVTITTAKSGHGNLTINGRPSRHATNTAVDIALLNGIGAGGASSGSNGNPEFRELGNRVKDELLNIGYSLNAEGGNQKAVLWQTNTGGNHFNHLHVSNKEGVSGSAGPSETMIKATPEMLNKLIELLKQKGVKSEDLKKYIDATKRDSNYNVNVNDWQGMVNLVINNLEGGYYHPDMLKDGRVSDARYGGSGETMFGLDREAGATESTGPAGREFWSFIDSQNARTNWKWNYMGKDNPALESKLRQLAGDVMKPQYIDNTRRYLSPEAADIISKDPALTFNFVYATWNGPGWFQRFAKIINQEVANGNTDPKSLLRIAVDRRISSGNSLIAQGGPKVDKITNRIASSSSVA
jgi:hypothetical protein